MFCAHDAGGVGGGEDEVVSGLQVLRRVGEAEGGEGGEERGEEGVLWVGWRAQDEDCVESGEDAEVEVDLGALRGGGGGEGEGGGLEDGEGGDEIAGSLVDDAAEVRR